MRIVRVESRCGSCTRGTRVRHQLVGMMGAMASPPSPPFGMPPSLPSPPGDPPSPPPIELLIADVVSWFWLSVLFAMTVISVVLRAASGRSLSAKPAGGFRVRVRGAFSRYAEQCMSWFPRSRDSAAGLLRAVAVGLLRVLAVLFLASAGLVFYGEARFSVTTSYSTLARSKEPTSVIHSPLLWPPGAHGFGPGLLHTFQRSASAAQAPHCAAVRASQSRRSHCLD